MLTSTNAPSPQDLVEHALSASTADDCIAIVGFRTSANLRWANNTLTTNGSMRGVHVTIISFIRSGSTTATASMSGSATTTDQVSALVEAADAAARLAPPADDAAELIGGAAAPEWGLAPMETTIGTYHEVAPGLGRAFTSAEAGGRVLYGFVDHEITTTYLGSSTGLRHRHVQPTGHYGCTAKSADLTRSAWVGGAAPDFRGLDAAGLDDVLGERLSWAERRIDLPAGRYDTILPPTSVADLAIYAYWTAAARIAHEGQSVYSRRGGGTRIGEAIARPTVQMYSDPGYAGLEAAPVVIAPSSGVMQSVFDNGLPLGHTEWIRDGVLTALLQTRHSARLTEQPVTPAVDNLVLSVDDGQGDLDDLIAGTERGLLVSSLWYIREVDPQSLLLTGLTRDGVYLVEDGAVVGAVNNFRFNESPIDLLGRFSHASETVPSFSREWGDMFSRTATPALRVPDFNMSSVSQAQ